MAVNSVGSQKTIQQIIEQSSQSTSDRKTGELGKDDFLNLLVTQLRYQDPLKPVDDKEFIAQMAQFSSLEQMQNMNSSFSSVKAYNLIGKYVTGNLVDSSSSELKPIEGTVTSVKVSQGKTFLVVNGEDVPVDNIAEVFEGAPAAKASNMSSHTGLIGYNVLGGVYDGTTGDVVPVNGTVQAIQKGTYEDYAVIDGAQVRISDINEGVLSADPDYMKNYLEENIGKVVSVSVQNPANGEKVPVKATLREYSVDDYSRITAILDGLSIPIDSISLVKPDANVTSEGEAADGDQ